MDFLLASDLHALRPRVSAYENKLPWSDFEQDFLQMK